MKQSSPVQPAQGLINTEVQWVNDSTGVCVCVYGWWNCLTTWHGIYAPLPTSQHMFAGWIDLWKIAEEAEIQKSELEEARLHGEGWVLSNAEWPIMKQKRSRCLCGVYSTWLCQLRERGKNACMCECVCVCLCVWGGGGGARCGQAITAMNGPAKYLMKH